MNNKIKRFVIPVIGIFVLVVGLLMFVEYENTQASQRDDQIQAHIAYCNHWSNMLSIDKKQLADTFLPSDSAYTQLNTEIANYNHECAY